MGKRAGQRAGSKDVESSTVSGPLELQQSEDLDAKIARVLRANGPDLGEGEDVLYLAASFVAYASDKHPQAKGQWCKVLAEVLDDAGVVLNDDDNEDAVSSVISALIARKVLVPVVAQIEEGSVVLALLTEDDDWHQAVVAKALGEDRFSVIFLEYGKPQETPSANIRLMEAVVDDEGAELEEGQCEMCTRHQLLTFHHLIPKDVHPTYLKKRLPPGVEGEPTRHFLNTHGTMICRQCHNFVHHLASNDVLAKEYNTLPKILATPSVQAWVKWIQQQGRPR